MSIQWFNWSLDSWIFSDPECIHNVPFINVCNQWALKIESEFRVLRNSECLTVLQARNQTHR